MFGIMPWEVPDLMFGEIEEFQAYIEELKRRIDQAGR